MPQLYTPFLAKATETLGQAYNQRSLNKLAGDAYMGDENAMSALMQSAPDIGIKLQEMKRKQQQQELQRAAATEEKQYKRTREEEDRNRRIFTENEDLIRGKQKDIAKLPFDQAAKVWKQFGVDYYDLLGDSTGELTPDKFEQIKGMYSEKDGLSQYERSKLDLEREKLDFKYEALNKKGELTPYQKSQLAIDYETLELKKAKQVREAKKGKKTTEGERMSANFLSNMREANAILDGEDLKDFNKTGWWETAKSLTNVTSSTKMQMYDQAKRMWVRSKLRKESGAVIGDDEMAREVETFFPRFGDSDEVIEQKTKARKIAERSLAISAGGAEEQIKMRAEDPKGDGGKPEDVSQARWDVMSDEAKALWD